MAGPAIGSGAYKVKHTFSHSIILRYTCLQTHDDGMAMIRCGTDMPVISG